MSHLRRVLLLLPLLLLCTSSSPAQAPSTGAVLVTSHQTAHELRDLCREYIASVDTGNPFGLNGPRDTSHDTDAGMCIGFIQGAVDGFAIAMTTHKAKSCVPKQATTDELIRITLKFIDEHPENLSDAAADVVWRTMIAFYPCPAK